MNLRFRKALKFNLKIFIFCFFFFHSLHSVAQIYKDSSRTYRVYLEPYLMFTNLSGTIGFGTMPNTFVCVPAGKVFSDLQIGGMLYGEVHNDHLAFTSDLFYANLDQDASTKDDVISGKAGLKQFWWELEGLYRLNSWLEIGLGARINNINASLDLITKDPLGSGSVSRTGSSTNTWVDPLIVTRLKTVLHDKWLLQLRADIGGFGVGSKLAWQLQPDIFYRASKLLQFGLGYRAISMDYEKGSGPGSFLYDVDEYGPQIRIGFNF